MFLTPPISRTSNSSPVNTSPSAPNCRTIQHCFPALVKVLFPSLNTCRYGPLTQVRSRRCRWFHPRARTHRYHSVSNLQDRSVSDVVHSYRCSCPWKMFAPSCNPFIAVPELVGSVIVALPARIVQSPVANGSFTGDAFKVVPSNS